MSSLRRRAGDSATAPAKQATKPGEHDVKDLDSSELTLVPSRELKQLQVQSALPKGTKRRFAWVFILGGLFGLVLAAYLANQNDLIDLAALSDLPLNIEPLLDVLPAGFLNDAREFQVHPLSCNRHDASNTACRNMKKTPSRTTPSPSAWPPAPKAYPPTTPSS